MADARRSERRKVPTAVRSGGVVQTDLESLPRLKDFRIEPEIAKTVQQALSDVFEAAKQANRSLRSVLSRQSPQQTTHLEHLQEQMGNLQQVVEALHRIGSLAIGMF